MRLRSYCLLFCLLMAGNAYAGEKLNHLQCVFGFDEEANQWRPMYMSWSGESYSLRPGEEALISGGWTDKSSTGVNHAYCNTMTATESSDLVRITMRTFRATSFDPVGQHGKCDVTGTDVERISKSESVLKRGEIAEVVVEWLPPRQKLVLVREYFPLVSEVDRMEEIAHSKCEEMTPRN